MKQVGILSSMIVWLVLTIVSAILHAFVILDIAKLYAVPLLSAFTLAQVLAVVVILRMITRSGELKKDKDDEQDWSSNPEGQLTKLFVSTGKSVALTLGIWGLMYLIHFTM